MRPSSKLTIFISAVSLFAALLLVLFASFGSHLSKSVVGQLSKRPSFRAPNHNVWAELTLAEAKDIYEFLHQSSNPLNLTKEPIGSGWENYVDRIEILRPNKTDVLAYIDSSGQQPSRWARVVVVQQNTALPMTVDYMAGPLPCDNSTKILPLTYPYNSGRNSVARPVPGPPDMYEFMIRMWKKNSDILEDIVGTSIDIFARPAKIVDDEMTSWVQIYRSDSGSDASTLLPQGLFFKFHTSRNPSSWYVSQWYYNGILYENMTSFHSAWSSPEFVKAQPNLGGKWTSKENFVTDVPGRFLPPPIITQANGPRYNLSRPDQYISYLGWTFYLATDAIKGLSLFDIRFDNSRIMYSLELQEVLVHYAGDDPFQSGLAFFDTFFGLGVASFSLVSGYDCPSYADYLDLTYYVAGQRIVNKNAICIFEYTSDAPLQRHTSRMGTTVSQNNYLIVRTVATVANYDYIFDYIFYLDGSIEVKVRASGFIIASFYPISPMNKSHATRVAEYGYRLHDAAASSIHDHVINFRADLDIAGTANSFHRVSVLPIEKSYDWDLSEQIELRKSMQLLHDAVPVETALNWAPNSAETFVIISNSSMNNWGEKRGYRILPGTGISNPAHLTIKNSSALLKSAFWAESDLFVLRRHDTEPASTNALDFLFPSDPLIDFSKMLNSENIEQEDLVLYFNLGSHHVPTSSDVPNTLMHTSASSVIFVPWNYFDRDASRERVSGVLVEPGGDAWHYFGGHQDDNSRTHGSDETGPGAFQQMIDMSVERLRPWLGLGRRLDIG